ncbi:lachesin-like isoform X2 [Paramacrobiotus metropolitanus]|uniref:lachesin-like isoform X2 n=1 Tax=Paramacrobiotus metropolitanus TaxID=2943436 RepID=UPI0024464CA6|nr:lachesin-like isoform X2 [Paramacrobiotus metropolitanus]
MRPWLLYPIGAIVPVIICIGCVGVHVEAAKKAHKNAAHGKLGRKPIEFDAQMENASVPLGKDAVFTCRINQSVKSADLQLVWLRLDSQTILAFENRLVQNNPRISVSHEERREFSLHIKNVQPEDAGHYACTINTNPLSQMRAHLDVLVPPLILANETTEHVVVREASNVSLKCAASGHPRPTISWVREDNMYITPKGEEKALTYNGSVLSLERVGRSDMATYICMAANGVPPAVSQRTTVKVEFPPMIWVEPKHVAAWIGGSATLKCETEAFPQAVHFWLREGVILTNSDKYDIRAEPAPEPHAYRMKMQLTIRNMDAKDFGDYTCSASNFHGSVEGAAKLYELYPHATIRTGKWMPLISVTRGLGCNAFMPLLNIVRFNRVVL